MKQSCMVYLVGLGLLVSSTLVSAGHTWQDLKGNKLNGEFVSKAGNVVTIRTEKGPVKVGFNSLVAEDQVYINKQMSTPTRRLGEKKFGEKPKFGDRSRKVASAPPVALGKNASVADKANAQIAAYREKKAAEEEERRKKTEEAKERFKKQMAERKKRNNSRRR